MTEKQLNACLRRERAEIKKISDLCDEIKESAEALEPAPWDIPDAADCCPKMAAKYFKKLCAIRRALAAAKKQTEKVRC